MGNLWKSIATPTLISSVLLGAIALLSVPKVSLAETSLANLPICESPKAKEYLVLVFTPSEPLQNEVRSQVVLSLSNGHDLLICQYSGNILSRVGGFDSLERATQWAQYFDKAVGLPLMVITPVEGEMQSTMVINPPMIPVKPPATPPDLVVATETTVSEPITPQVTGKLPTSPSFQPKALSGGYGVLVDYGADPAIAPQLKTLLGKNIGLVVYASHGYLLAEQTPNSDRVTELLNLLSRNGLGAIAAPADQLILLKENVTP